MKKAVLFLFSIALLVSSCGTLAVVSGGEVLDTLTKVTDSDEPCGYPFGGDNGKNLFYAGRSNGKYFNIYFKENAFSSAVGEKTNGKNMNTSPAYCDVTKKIAFSCQNEGMSTSDIYMMNSNQGRALSPITESSDAYESSPSFNNDGTMLVYDKISYTYLKKGKTTLWNLSAPNLIVVQHSEIWTKNLVTGENTLLGTGAEPAFSPDGKRIAYTKYSTDAKSCSLWVMDVDGSNPMQITDAKRGIAHNPAWSPDGKHLVFQTYKKDKKDYDIYIVDTDGENLTQITTNKSWDGEPYWSNDGFIYFTSDRGNKPNNFQIWRFKIH